MHASVDIVHASIDDSEDRPSNKEDGLYMPGNFKQDFQAHSFWLWLHGMMPGAFKGI